MDRDLPGEGLRRGDTVLTYTYLGEGISGEASIRPDGLGEYE